jgi:ligand-binding sensor domain-containing protein
MKSSKNPKILNYVIKSILDPIFRLLEELKNKEWDAKEFIRKSTKEADDNNDAVKEAVAAYMVKDDLLNQAVINARSRLSDMIRSSLYNPNIPDGEEGVGGETIPNTPLLIDKPITDIDFGFIKDGNTILLAGVIGRGLAIGRDNDIAGDNFIFSNPSNIKFPSFYINDILKISTTHALIGSNHGLIEYDVATTKSLVRTTSHGLNTNTVKAIAPVLNSANEQAGYLAGTTKGMCFSPNGVRWLNVDLTFKNVVTCFHSTQSLDKKTKFVFVGTTRGLYYFDASSYIDEVDKRVIYLKGIINISPSAYINAIAYNSIKDALYLATDNGVLVINGIMAYMAAKNYDEPPPNYRIYGSNQGLSSTLCFDLALMPNQKLVIATANGLTITTDFINFSYITRKISGSNNQGLESYMCEKLVRRNAVSLTVLHSIGLTEGITI